MPTSWPVLCEKLMKKPSEKVVLTLICCIAILVICLVGFAYEYGWFSKESVPAVVSSIVSSEISSSQTTSRLPLGVVDINVVEYEELCQVPGMTETLAKQILDYRATDGPFKKLSQLGEIPEVDQEVLIEVLPFLSCES